MPQTGDQANETFIVLTGALALAAAYILLKQEKRKRNENE
ncbi:LPXTG cell wall anchor domain-containing protein [Listeria floridensis]